MTYNTNVNVRCGAQTAEGPPFVPIAGGTGTAAEKMSALTARANAGEKVVKSPADMGKGIQEVLGR
jgi:hypothetical protein